MLDLSENLKKMNKYVKVFAPATVANVICGYDVLGFALNAPGDEVEIELKKTPGVELTEITGDQGLLPRDPLKNTVTATISGILEKIGRKDLGISVKLHKKMPIGSGLGSSAASTVAGIFGVNKLLGEPLSIKELMPFALKGEEIACGHGHADNVAPSLYGGFVLIRSYEPLDIIPLPTPEKLIATVIHPQIEIQTRDARKIVRQHILLRDAIEQWGNIAGLVSGLYRSDYALIGRSLEDRLIEPSRAILIPEFYELKKNALALGALGFGISGSGPSVFALCDNLKTAQNIKTMVQSRFEQVGVNSHAFVSSVNADGPRVLSVQS